MIGWRFTYVLLYMRAVRASAWDIRAPQDTLSSLEISLFALKATLTPDIIKMHKCQQSAL